MARGLYAAVGAAIYLIFFATFLYLIAFVGDIALVPRTVDLGPQAQTGVALAIDAALIALFGIQHSVMARRGFKAAWTRIVPPVLERSGYVLASSLVLLLLFAFWRPIPQAVWTVTNPIGRDILWALFGLGWAIVLLSTFLINHFELFGLQQIWRNLTGRGESPAQFRTPFLYRLVRHPLYSGFILAFWAIPVMTIGHLLLALGMTGYILIAIGYEERDLVGTFGDEYRRYRRTTGMLIPGIGRSKA
ncbi:MAG: isoprenylcysteine carboxylmethyltransferase family protein [Sphingomonas sp.]|uniref:methanethiol S-methyltransferase n=1 Tax=Sphingomonas sp. TaxID=28214 RepID=UPI00120E4DFF|nr:methanethiol S-methyltransferase [Sphingomonas sp.]THD37353.1 MAG: isoprenylcysteine carboxylmethyltransferase family protein [Sphingomonas sp.]